MSIQVAEQVIDTDEEGFIVNLNDWSKELAEQMAADDHLNLTDEHWDVINFLREYYEQYQIAPPIRALTKAIAKKLGAEKGTSKYLYTLFPYGPAKQACRYAGLPKPTGCV